MGHRHGELGEHLAIQENARLRFVINHVSIGSSEEACRSLLITPKESLSTLIRIIHSFRMSRCFSFRPTYLDITPTISVRTLWTGP